MNIVSREFIKFAEQELATVVKRFANSVEEVKATQIAKEIVELIDWNDSALMHKGFSWMAKNYLAQKDMLV
ncbi:MAG: hypothetical protein IJZ53_06850 [Tyzzerella sp.]|nr:hypothetical protein [Tyzzerella sp.]